MIPKSTVKLKEGDFAWIERDDGMFVPFVFISRAQGKRSYFYGGIAELVASRESELPPNLNIEKYALLHIDAFKKNELSIEGNLSNKLKNGLIDSLQKKITDFSVGSKSNVWGYRTIYKYANAVNA